MSIVVRLIHERHSMGPTPSCLTISVLHISRSWKYVITMNLKCSNKWNIDLERLFYKYFCKFPHFLGSKCWILSYHKSYNTDIKQRNRPKSSAKALLEKNLKTKHRGDPYLTFMNISFNKYKSFFTKWTSMVICVGIYIEDAPFPKSLRFAKLGKLGLG